MLHQTRATAFGQWLRGFRPVRTPVPMSERARAALGALLGIALTGLVTRFWLGDSEAVPLLIAPMGASAVLLFAVPASPLAQPWPVLGGNMIAAIIGVTVAKLIGDPVLAAALAVAIAIGVTAYLGCLHPPAGAVALTAVLGGPAVTAAGYHFVLVPVGVNTLLILGTALLFNNATRRGYPHHAPPPPAPMHRTADPPSENRIGFTGADIDAALAKVDPLDIDRDDIEALLRAVEAQAHRRLHGAILCADIMSRDLVTVRDDEPRLAALAKLDRHMFRSLPVMAENGGILGVVDRATLLAGQGDLVNGLAHAEFETARAGAPIDDLLPILSHGHVHEVLIVDPEDRLIGIVTQTDLLAALYRGAVTRAIDTNAG